MSRRRWRWRSAAAAIAGRRRCSRALLNYRHSAPMRSAPSWASVDGSASARAAGAHELSDHARRWMISAKGFGLTAQTDRRLDPRRVIGYVHTALAVAGGGAGAGAADTPALALSCCRTASARRCWRCSTRRRRRIPHEQLRARAVRRAGAAHAGCGRGGVRRSSR